MFSNRRVFFILSVVMCCALSHSVNARAKIAAGAHAGAEISLSDRHQNKTGLHLEGSVESVDNSLFFSYKRLFMDIYTVGYEKKVFFTEEDYYVRPYLEAGFGINIVDYPARDLYFGCTPLVGFGVELALASWVSVASYARYNMILYFGDTDEGKIAHKHTISVAGALKAWF